MKARFNIKPFDAEGLNHNKVKLGLDYDKKRGGPLLYMQTVAETPDGFEKFSIFGSPRSSMLIEAGWRTNNKKKLAATWERVVGQLEARSGPVWDNLCAFLRLAGSDMIF